ncbi:hypothetical protein BDW59DRAFT_148545 [Aspergillus cavernicola]|uniref:Uncharacterized protein n=1 Tax=Aspergillus cavernicola TaxID=176166 RepID=A0ABR4I7I5_9EURO
MRMPEESERRALLRAKGFGVIWGFSKHSAQRIRIVEAAPPRKRNWRKAVVSVVFSITALVVVCGAISRAPSCRMSFFQSRSGWLGLMIPENRSGVSGRSGMERGTSLHGSRIGSMGIFIEDLTAISQRESSKSTPIQPRSSLLPSTSSLIIRNAGPSAGFHSFAERTLTASSTLHLHRVFVDIP